ncbi:MAG: hypothetical protein HDQ88_06445 [Clostridia bacterium]|nr:hypothetical protein [Clostridia bacterium]
MLGKCIISLVYPSLGKEYYVIFDGYGNPTFTPDKNIAHIFETKEIAERILRAYRREIQSKTNVDVPHHFDVQEI